MEKRAKKKRGLKGQTIKYVVSWPSVLKLENFLLNFARPPSPRKMAKYLSLQDQSANEETSIYDSVYQSTSSQIGVFKLIFKWKNSIYKLIWRNFVIYMTLFFGLNLLYRYVLIRPGNEWLREWYEISCIQCGRLFIYVLTISSYFNFLF